MPEAASRLGVSPHSASSRVLYRAAGGRVHSLIQAYKRQEPVITQPLPSESIPATDLLALVTAALEDLKAEDIVTFDLRGRTSIADSMVIASGRSSRQVGAMADHIGRALKQAGCHVSSEGEPQCDWVLVDAGDIVVHLFRPEVRAFYNLEKIWARPAETAAAAAPRPQAAPGL